MKLTVYGIVVIYIKVVVYKLSCLSCEVFLVICSKYCTSHKVLNMNENPSSSLLFHVCTTSSMSCFDSACYASKNKCSVWHVSKKKYTYDLSRQCFCVHFCRVVYGV